MWCEHDKAYIQICSSFKDLPLKIKKRNKHVEKRVLFVTLYYYWQIRNPRRSLEQLNWYSDKIPGHSRAVQFLMLDHQFSCVVFCRSFFVPFLSAIVLSVLLRFTVTDSHSGIFKLFWQFLPIFVNFDIQPSYWPTHTM